MNSFFQQQGFSIESIEIQLREITCQIEYMKTKHPLDVEANLFFDWCLKKHVILYGLIKFNPRFGWVEIQREMDRLYREDRSITEFQLILNIKETTQANRALIKRNISKL